MLSNVFTICKMHLISQTVRGTCQNQKRVNIDPYDPNVSNFRDTTLRNTLGAIRGAPPCMSVCRLVCSHFGGLPGSFHVNVTSSLPLQQLHGCRLLVPLSENICYSLSRIETEHKTVFQGVVPPTPHPSVSWKKTNSKMRTESQANIVPCDDTFIYIHIYMVAGGREILVPDLVVGQWSSHTLVAACHPSG